MYETTPLTRSDVKNRGPLIKRKVAQKANVVLLPSLKDDAVIERLVGSTNSAAVRTQSAELLEAIYSAAELVHQECQPHLLSLSLNANPELERAFATLDACA